MGEYSDFVVERVKRLDESDVADMQPALRDSIVARIKSLFRPVDWEGHNADIAEFTEPAGFSYDEIDATRITHPAVAMMLDPEAEYFDYCTLSNGKRRLHVVAARGGNSCGIVVDDAGRAFAEIHDAAWYLPQGQGDGAIERAFDSLQALWYEAEP